MQCIITPPSFASRSSGERLGSPSRDLFENSHTVGVTPIVRRQALNVRQKSLLNLRKVLPAVAKFVSRHQAPYTVRANEAAREFLSLFSIFRATKAKLRNLATCQVKPDPALQKRDVARTPLF